MDPYRVFLSSIVNPTIGDLLGDAETSPPGAVEVSPIAVPWSFDDARFPSRPSPNFYIDGLNVNDSFVLIIGSRITRQTQMEYQADRPCAGTVLAHYRNAQFGEAGVEEFLLALETKSEFIDLLQSLDARYDRRRDGLLAPVQLADNLQGRTICLYRGGGIGDAIHYVRYARALKSRGARIIVLCGEREAPLLAQAEGVDTVVIGKEASVCDPVLPDLPRCDLGISFVAVPFTCGFHSADICWQGPYIRVDPQRAHDVRLRIGTGATLKVGLCWHSGGGGERAIKIQELLPMLRAHAHGVDFFSLQRGPHQADLEAIRNEEIRITDLETPESSLSDTAAVISNLDLVISVDTMICHLAGAIDRPVWTLLAYEPDWRWSVGRDNTPWYPSMRLFRQGPDRHYGPVVDQMTRELTGFRSVHRCRSRSGWNLKVA